MRLSDFVVTACCLACSLRMLDLENEFTTALQNVGNYTAMTHCYAMLCYVMLQLCTLYDTLGVSDKVIESHCSYCSMHCYLVACSK